MHSDLYSDDLDSMTNNLRNSANGTFVTSDDTFPLTDDTKKIDKVLATGFALWKKKNGNAEVVTKSASGNHSDLIVDKAQTVGSFMCSPIPWKKVVPTDSTTQANNSSDIFANETRNTKVFSLLVSTFDPYQIQVSKAFLVNAGK